MSRRRPGRLEGRQKTERNRRFLARAENALCAWCKQGICQHKKLSGQHAYPCVRTSEEVDHKLAIELGGTETDSNLQGLCKDCHPIKTADDRRKMAGLPVKQRIGTDGYSIEEQPTVTEQVIAAQQPKSEEPAGEGTKPAPKFRFGVL